MNTQECEATGGGGKLLMIHELGANELEFYTNLFWSHFNYRYLMLKKTCNFLLMLGCRQLSAHAHFHMQTLL